MAVTDESCQAQTWPPTLSSVLFAYGNLVPFFVFVFLLMFFVRCFLWQWFVAAAAPELITADCDRPSNPLWGTVRRTFRLFLFGCFAFAVVVSKALFLSGCSKVRSQCLVVFIPTPRPPRGAVPPHFFQQTFYCQYRHANRCFTFPEVSLE